MASSNTTIDLLLVSHQLNRYFGLLIFIFGLTGNLLNCLIFSQKTFRTNSCAYLFLVSAIVDVICLIFGLSTRILAAWSMDPTARIDWICKLRVFIVFTTRTIAIWLIMIASIDRWLLSN
jgi:hypothetical protein